jgi:predicted metal-binding membrane protein
MIVGAWMIVLAAQATSTAAVLHHLALIEVGVLALAGGYQLLSIKRRALAACRHRGDPTPLASLPGPSATRLGLRHGLECLGSSWALMLVMLAAGFASV